MVALASSCRFSFSADALGRRVGRDDGTDDVVYFQDGQQTLADYASGASASSPTYTYVYGSYIDEPVYRDGTGGVRYYHRNQQYSITALTDSSGGIVERYAYDAYGDVTFTNASGTVQSSSASDNRYTYTGREWDDDLGLYHYRARMYDPVSGRFLGRDPIRYSGGVSLYNSYMSLIFTDPTGTQIVDGAAPNDPVEPAGESCTFKVCSSPVAGGKAGHLFILCGGNRYRGGPSGEGNQNEECGDCDGKYGQLVTNVDPWKDKPLDHPENPDAPYDPDDMLCEEFTVEGKSCDKVCGCMKEVADAINGCCVPYTPVPGFGPGRNSNSTVRWMIQTCTDMNKPGTPGRTRPHPGYGSPMPKCVGDATKNLANM